MIRQFVFRRIPDIEEIVVTKRKMTRKFPLETQRNSHRATFVERKARSGTLDWGYIRSLQTVSMAPALLFYDGRDGIHDVHRVVRAGKPLHDANSVRYTYAGIEDTRN